VFIGLFWKYQALVIVSSSLLGAYKALCSVCRAVVGVNMALLGLHGRIRV